MEAAGKDKACLHREEHLTDGDAEIARDVKPAGMRLVLSQSFSLLSIDPCSSR